MQLTEKLKPIKYVFMFERSDLSDYVQCPRAVVAELTSFLCVPQVTQLYVPSARHVWRTRRMGRIGPLQSTLDGSVMRLNVL